MKLFGSHSDGGSDSVSDPALHYTRMESVPLLQRLVNLNVYFISSSTAVSNALN
jgi:hypothetical protein